MSVVHIGRADTGRMSLFFLMAVSVMAHGQAPSSSNFCSESHRRGNFVFFHGSQR